MTAHVVTNRLVLTWEDPWPLGVLTGYEHEGGFALEHVVAFPGAPPSTLARMLRAGLTEAWRRGYQHVTLHIPHAYPLAAGLLTLAKRFGFDEYRRDEGASYFVAYRRGE